MAYYLIRRGETVHYLWLCSYVHIYIYEGKICRFRPKTTLQMPKASVPASPGMWAKAVHKLAAVIRHCGDRVMSKEVRRGGV